MHIYTSDHLGYKILVTSTYVYIFSQKSLSLKSSNLGTIKFLKIYISDNWYSIWFLSDQVVS